jgi:PAS domain S-box-containing protein
MPDALRVLVVEDSEDDAFLTLRELRRGGFDPQFERVETAEAMSAALDRQPWDLIISDYSIPSFGGRAALALYQQKGLDIPFITMSGVIGEETAVEMMKAGAHDYVMKGNLARLVPAVKRELHAAQERLERKKAETARAHMAAIVASCEDAILSESLDGTVLSWNAAAQRMYGYTAEEMIGRSIAVLIPAYRPNELPGILQRIRQGELVEGFETVRICKSGEAIDVSVTLSPIRNTSGQVTGASAISRDITQRKREEQERIKLIQDLTDALTQVKTLGGLLPICASCKKIRDDKGYWQQVETYIKLHSNADFTHGICPECAQRLYPDYNLKSATEEQVEREQA